MHTWQASFFTLNPMLSLRTLLFYQRTQKIHRIYCLLSGYAALFPFVERDSFLLTNFVEFIFFVFSLLTLEYVRCHVQAISYVRAALHQKQQRHITEKKLKVLSPLHSCSMQTHICVCI